MADIMAMQYGLNAQPITLMVGAGTVLPFVMLPLWWTVFSHL